MLGINQNTFLTLQFPLNASVSTYISKYFRSKGIYKFHNIVSLCNDNTKYFQIEDCKWSQWNDDSCKEGNVRSRYKLQKAVGNGKDCSGESTEPCPTGTSNPHIRN